MKFESQKEPIIKFYKNKAYWTNSVHAIMNDCAFATIGKLDEIVFCPRKLTIKEPTIFNQKTYKVYGKSHSFGFGVVNDNLEELLGNYTIEKVAEGEFILKKIKNN